MRPLNQDLVKKRPFLAEASTNTFSVISRNPNPSEIGLSKNLDSIEVANRDESSLMSGTLSGDSRTGFYSADSSCLSNNLAKAVKLRQEMPQLYPPGRILHVVRKYPRTAFDNRNRYTCYLKFYFVIKK